MSNTDPLWANFLEAIKLDRYNANWAPLFNAFVARFRLDMFSSFFKLMIEEREEELERMVVMISGRSSRQLSKSQLGSIMKSICPIFNDAVSTTLLFTF